MVKEGAYGVLERDISTETDFPSEKIAIFGSHYYGYVLKLFMFY